MIIEQAKSFQSTFGKQACRIPVDSDTTIEVEESYRPPMAPEDIEPTYRPPMAPEDIEGESNGR